MYDRGLKRFAREQRSQLTDRSVWYTRLSNRGVQYNNALREYAPILLKNWSRERRIVCVCVCEGVCLCVQYTGCWMDITCCTAEKQKIVSFSHIWTIFSFSTPRNIQEKIYVHWWEVYIYVFSMNVREQCSGEEKVVWSYIPLLVQYPKLCNERQYKWNLFKTCTIYAKRPKSM